jgi:hypothetical protein
VLPSEGQNISSDQDHLGVKEELVKMTNSIRPVTLLLTQTKPDHSLMMKMRMEQMKTKKTSIILNYRWKEIFRKRLFSKHRSSNTQSLFLMFVKEIGRMLSVKTCLLSKYQSRVIKTLQCSILKPTLTKTQSRLRVEEVNPSHFIRE